jgi:uncharacterized repeat protein (TIGR01451 family)
MMVLAVLRGGRRAAVAVAITLATISLLIAVQTLRAQQLVPSEPEAPEIQLVKSVSKNQATAGSTLGYTVVLSNSGTEWAGAMFTDTLPAGLTYVAGSLTVVGGPPGEGGNVITWSGAVNVNTPITLTFSALLDSSLPAGEVITNTAEVEVTATGEVLTVTTTTTIVEQTDTNLYLPLISKPVPVPGPVTLNPISRPNSSNQWIISWSGGSVHTTGYELQESHTSDFSAVTTYPIDDHNATARQANHPPSFRNVYYYRIRAVGPGGHGPWSGTQMVIGGYRDDFNDNTSGWAIRRTTFIEKVRTWYEPYNNGQDNRLIMQVEDSWDWGITSPLAPAPSIPYAIEYRAEIAHLGNLVSHGVVFGGDWNGQPCPDWSSVPGVYQHTNCFNHFYNTNIIWHGPLSLIFEWVDRLVWCPECGGSPMKRLGDTPWHPITGVPNVNANGANTYRVEVRANGIRLFANNQQYFQTNHTTWVNEPYFGIFASTDEYSNSTWRINYFQILPLDE